MGTAGRVHGPRIAAADIIRALERVDTNYCPKHWKHRAIHALVSRASLLRTLPYVELGAVSASASARGQACAPADPWPRA